MAGSLSHIVGDDGRFTIGTIESIGDTHEALDECFRLIYEMTGGSTDKVNRYCRGLGFPEIEHDMKGV